MKISWLPMIIDGCLVWTPFVVIVTYWCLVSTKNSKSQLSLEFDLHGVNVVYFVSAYIFDLFGHQIFLLGKTFMHQSFIHGRTQVKSPLKKSSADHWFSQFDNSTWPLADFSRVGRTRILHDTRSRQISAAGALPPRCLLEPPVLPGRPTCAAFKGLPLRIDQLL